MLLCLCSGGCRPCLSVVAVAFAKQVVSTVSRVRHPRNGDDICSESCLCGNNALILLVFACVSSVHVLVVYCTCVMRWFLFSIITMQILEPRHCYEKKLNTLQTSGAQTSCDDKTARSVRTRDSSSHRGTSRDGENFPSMPCPR